MENFLGQCVLFILTELHSFHGICVVTLQQLLIKHLWKRSIHQVLLTKLLSVLCQLFALRDGLLASSPIYKWCFTSLVNCIIERNVDVVVNVTAAKCVLGDRPWALTLNIVLLVLLLLRLLGLLTGKFPLFSQVLLHFVLFIHFPLLLIHKINRFLMLLLQQSFGIRRYLSLELDFVRVHNLEFFTNKFYLEI